MQRAQNPSSVPPPPSSHNMQNLHNEGPSVPFPPPSGIPPGQIATGGVPNILSVLAVALGGLHDSTTDKFAHLDAVVRDLTASVTAVREAGRVDSLKLAEWLDKAHDRQMKATMLVLERVRALERTVGEVKSLHGDETITARMQRIDCALTELLEQVQDPDAGFTAFGPSTGGDSTTPLPTRHFMNRSVSPIAPPVYVDASVGGHPTEHVDASVAASQPLPVHVDANVNTTERKMMDTGSATASLELVDIGVGTASIVLADASVGNSPQQYADAGVDAPGPEDSECMRTPTRMPRSLHVFGPGGVAMGARATSESELTHKPSSQADVRLHARFPTSPFNSDPMVPAQWSPNRSDSPRSELSYVSRDGGPDASSAWPAAASLPVAEVDVDNLESTLQDRRSLPGDDSVETGGREPTPRAGVNSVSIHDDVSAVPVQLQTGTRPADLASTSSAIRSSEHLASAEVTHPPRAASTSGISIGQSVSSITAVNSPGDSAMSPTITKPSSSSTTDTKTLPLPRKPSQRARSHSLSTLSSLSPPPSPQVTRTRPGARIFSLSPSPPPPPPPPLPRRKMRDTLRTQPPAASSAVKNETRIAEPARGRKRDARQSSSPEIQIIEKPAAFVDKNKSRDHDRSKSKGKHEKSSKTRERDRRLDLDEERPRKRRKTDGDALARTGKKPGSKPRKSLGAQGTQTQTQSRKGKQVARVYPDSSPQPEDGPPVDDADCQWPDIIEGDETYQREYINCDNCDAWYHYGCAGLPPDDPRLTEQDSVFFCPPCEVAGDERKGRYTGKTADTAKCARPNCGASDTNQWFIECIIGRRPSQTQPGSGGMPKFLWLVKWDGWNAGAATWEFPENLGEHSQLIAEFEVAIGLEGKDLNDPYVPALLNEAAAAGW